MSDKSRLETNLEELSPEQFKKAQAAFEAEASKRDGMSLGEFLRLPEYEKDRQARKLSARYAKERAKRDLEKLAD